MSDETPGPVGPGASSRPGDVVDGDALRAARLEQVGERYFRLGGKDWALVAEVPFVYAEMWRDGRRVEASKLLFAEVGDGDKFFAMTPAPSSEDMAALVAVFNTTAGKSSAS